MVGEARDYINRLVQKKMNELFSLHTQKPQTNPDIDVVTFTNPEKTKGTLSDGTEVNTVPVGKPGTSEIGYKLADGSYMVKKDPLRIKTLTSSSKSFKILVSELDNDTAIQTFYVIKKGSDKRYRVVNLPALPHARSDTIAQLSPDGRHLVVLNYFQRSNPGTLPAAVYFFENIEFDDDTSTVTTTPTTTLFPYTTIYTDDSIYSPNSFNLCVSTYKDLEGRSRPQVDIWITESYVVSHFTVDSPPPDNEMKFRLINIKVSDLVIDPGFPLLISSITGQSQPYWHFNIGGPPIFGPVLDSLTAFYFPRSIFRTGDTTSVLWQTCPPSNFATGHIVDFWCEGYWASPGDGAFKEKLDHLSLIITNPDFQTPTQIYIASDQYKVKIRDIDPQAAGFSSYTKFSNMNWTVLYTDGIYKSYTYAVRVAGSNNFQTLKCAQNEDGTFTTTVAMWKYNSEGTLQLSTSVRGKSSNLTDTILMTGNAPPFLTIEDFIAY
jgi:hypothetical protein